MYTCTLVLTTYTYKLNLIGYSYFMFQGFICCTIKSTENFFAQLRNLLARIIPGGGCSVSLAADFTTRRSCIGPLSEADDSSLYLRAA